MRGYRGQADDPSGNTCSLTGLSGYLQGLLYPPSPQRSWATSPSGGSSGGSGQAPWSVPSLRVVGGGASRHEWPPQALAPRTDFTKLDLEWDSSRHCVTAEALAPVVMLALSTRVLLRHLAFSSRSRRGLGPRSARRRCALEKDRKESCHRDSPDFTRLHSPEFTRELGDGGSTDRSLCGFGH